jgi:uncharacterized protein (UPF0332 family)
MLSKKEIDIISLKFEKFIRLNKISKPKPNKKEFFKNKANTSLNLAKKILQGDEYFDWVINISYYSMYYNAITLLAHINVDLNDLNESTHVIAYQALVYYFHIKKTIIEEKYINDFKSKMEQSNDRLKTIAKQKALDLISNFKNAKDKRGEIQYELGETAESQSAKTAIRRAEAFDMLTEKILFDH